MTGLNGTLRIKNKSSSVYSVVELGGYPLNPGQVIDLLDPELPVHYEDWSSANRLVVRCPKSQLYKDIQAGTILVVDSRPKL